MRLVRRLYSFISSPFKENFVFFLVLFFLASSVDFINRFYHVGFSSGVFWSLFGYVECYVLCLLIPCFNERFRKVYKNILVFLGIMNFSTDFVVSMISTNRGFNEFVGLILGTNFNEISEFIQHYLSFPMIFLVILCCSLLYLSYRKLKHIKISTYLTIFNLAILMIAVPIIRNDTWGHSENIFIGKLFTIVKEYNKNNHDLKEYYSNPKLIVEKELPQILVVIIGESYAKKFSSLYGYEKQTNPYLSQLPDTSLFVYKNVTSGDVSTVENIEYILSTYSHDNCQRDWYEYPTLIEILAKLKYRTYWISNQAKVGLWDNIPSKYAFLCDSTIFVGPQKSFNELITYDENVIQSARSIMENDEERKVLFIHLIGSHPGFKQRYPHDRVKFTAADYTNYEKNQRQVRAHYDNSLIYNDSVVNEIFKLGKNRETLFFYFPDHGLDVYELDANYVGHGRRGNKKSEEIAKKIPFMIYPTDSYKKKYTREVTLMRQSINNQFVTENFIYTLMDIIGVRFAQNKEVDKYSLFRNCTSESLSRDSCN